MGRKHRAWAVVGSIVLAALPVSTAACDPGDDAVHTPQLRVQVVATRPHDRTAFTEGLEIDGGLLYESTGLEGRSTLRVDDATTGAQLGRVDLPPEFFGEGVTRVGDTVWQITWKNQVAFARDPLTLAERTRAHYDGEGWGLCTRADRVVMSNGTDTLTFRDPATFAETGTVRLADHPAVRLNSLNCAADGTVYANAWPTDHILHIDPDNGRVLGDIDAAGLLAPTDKPGTDVLNGIAQIPGTDRFLLSGKNWPLTFEVRFVPV
ncbi:glutaminyl-peptide cyclotransferase [Nocardia sp. BMG111209]|uniref:glutaminyl-peptide cyclotransferase n=1 Tax=Nocardia sp. BMG111209 TaxID=1160137 RepID=UPI0003605087|nr:glutaminyl-peptide cyclotransferase [Nocardia sp. BMG111209]